MNVKYYNLNDGATVEQRLSSRRSHRVDSFNVLRPKQRKKVEFFLVKYCIWYKKQITRMSPVVSWSEYSN